MGDREANALLREINATLDAPTTPASRRIAASVALLGPLTFHFVDPESASVATSLADFIGAGHLREPLGNAVGLTDPQHLACISTMVRDALRIDADRRSGSASLILRAGGVIVAAVMIAQPRGNTPEPTPGCDAEKRLYDAMAWADDRAREAFKAVTGLDLHETPELALSLVAQEFRGSLGDEGSIYQRMTRACEARLRAMGYRSLYAHSNETSGARHVRDGWDVVFQCRYNDMPGEFVTGGVEGEMVVCCHLFDMAARPAGGD